MNPEVLVSESGRIGGFVAGYRLYFLDHARHIRDVVVIDCGDDAEACAEVDTYRDGRAMELWLRDRMVQAWPAQDMA